MAATLNEKGIDPYLADIAILKGIELYQEICAAKVGSKIYDNFSSPPKAKQLNVKKTKINTLLGMEIDKKEITAHLEALGYTAKWSGDNLTTTPPTWRITDTAIPEDIIEEIARIEGYHNLPSTLMSGDLPSKISMQANYFASISDIKSELKALGGTEIMTLSLVSKEGVSDDALKLKNPLGKDTKYLRTSMKLSLINVTEENLGWSEPYHIFEISNTYQPAKGSLPNEVLTLAGIIHGEKFRNAKGIIEHLLSTKFKGAKFRKSSARTLDIIIGGNKSGLFDASDPKNIYYEINISDAQVNFNRDVQIINLPKHPPQIEDITLKIDPLTPVGNVYNTIKNSHKNVQTVELVDQYKRNFTFRIYYQDPAKTLTDQEVASLRKIIEGRLKKLDTKI
jgi:phenylalanyl-tRNA synthetase beta chain